MESISERERILLGYAPRDSFGGAETRLQRWNSDVDFLDVFGGPPRRSSVYESRRSRADSIDSYSRLSRGREDLVGSHRSSLGSGDNPVFSDGVGSGRRQQLGDDFYGDIFQISESDCSSPTRDDLGPLMSSPLSRVSSTKRSTLPRGEPLSGGSLFGMQPSLSETMSKVLDHPAFGSPTKRSVYRSEEGGCDSFGYPSSPNGSSTGFFTTQSVSGYGDLGNNDYGSYRKSPLSGKIPLGFEGFSEPMEPAFRTIESKTGEISSSLEDYICNRQFHFSIYKWAGKGIMLVMPSDSDEKNGFEGLTSLPEVIVQELELPADCDYFSPVTKPSQSGTVIQEIKSDKKADEYAETCAKISHADSGLKFLKVVTNKISDKYGNQSEKASAPDFDENSTTINTDRKPNLEFRFNVHSEQDPELKNLSQLFDNDIDKQRSHNIPRHVKDTEAQSKVQKMKQLRRESKLVPDEVNSTTLHDILSSSEDKPRGNKVKGKVIEFIKKFNQETSPKRKGAFEMLNRRSMGEDSGRDKVDKLAHVSSIEPDKLQGQSGDKSMPSFDLPNNMENQVIEKAEEVKSNISCNDQLIENRPSEERVEVLHLQSEPTLEDLNNPPYYEDIIHEDIEYLVQQLPIKQTEGAQNSSQPDQIKHLDSKIRHWSKGKEGNIRSLLSTLQLVLWPESGWKQVPLVNIIEGPSVKKAYQKALLCLHPDKLQQKGASWNQKYIAEKVFDILQEAWDHFNSVSQF